MESRHRKDLTSIVTWEKIDIRITLIMGKATQESWGKMMAVPGKRRIMLVLSETLSAGRTAAILSKTLLASCC
jgi:dihydrofolate reductase